MKDLNKKTEKELIKAVSDKRAEIRTIKFGTSGAGAKNVKASKNAKREVARLMTELRTRTK